jgi:CBS domain containing-hemolysin-like protein
MIGEPCNIENVTTVGGLVTQLLSSFPTPGKFVRLGDWTLTVEKTKDRRAETLILKRDVSKK